MTPRERKVMRRFMEVVLNYIEDNPLKDPALLRYQDYKSLAKTFDTSITEKGISDEDLLLSIQSYFKHCVRTFDPQFLGKSYAGYNLPGLMGEILSNVTNTSMATYVASPVATLIENTLIRKMADVVGFENGDGIFVPGGTQANLIALLCARNTVNPTIKREGLRHGCDLVLFVSDQAHYSFIIAANLLGIGFENVIRVQSDEVGRMNVEALEEAIEISAGKGKLPFFVGATAGTTVLGAFDPIERIAEIASKYGLWLHIDAAWGGSVLLSKNCRALLAGSELADSFSWDAHKMMNVPLPCSIILTRNQGILYDSCTTCDFTTASSYVFHSLGEPSVDLGQKSLQCTRKVDALKLWLAWRYYGDEGYEKRIDRVLGLAQYAEERIDESPRLELVFPRQFANLCFRYVSLTTKDIDRFTKSLQDSLVATGRVFLGYSDVKGRGVLRLNVINPQITEADLDYSLECVIEAGEKLDEF